METNIDSIVSISAALILLSSLIVFAISGLIFLFKWLKYMPVRSALKKCDRAERRYQGVKEKFNEVKKRLSNSQDMIVAFDIQPGTVDSEMYERQYSSDDLEKLTKKLAQAKVALDNLKKDKEITESYLECPENVKKAYFRKITNTQIMIRTESFFRTLDLSLKSVNWSNINRLTRRLEMAYYYLNHTGEASKTKVNPAALDFAKRYLKLSYELNLAKEEINEEIRQERLQKRQAEREEKRLKAAIERAERDRIIMEKLIEKEIAKLESEQGSKAELNAIIEKHQKELKVLQEKESRARSMAELTRRGYVYVISNKNSFHRPMVKIGMTRRLDPNERVRELGDASVPFLFDTHGFVYTEDAPKLESELHKHFASRRVNLVNTRKEFFLASAEEVIHRINELGYETRQDLIENS